MATTDRSEQARAEGLFFGYSYYQESHTKVCDPMMDARVENWGLYERPLPSETVKQALRSGWIEGYSDAKAQQDHHNQRWSNDPVRAAILKASSFIDDDHPESQWKPSERLMIYYTMAFGTREEGLAASEVSRKLAEAREYYRLGKPCNPFHPTHSPQTPAPHAEHNGEE